MGWIILLPGRESDIVSVLFTKTYVHDYEKLCYTDVLGLKESHYKHDDYVYEKFKKQHKREKRLVLNWVRLERRKFTFGYQQKWEFRKT